MRRRAIAVAVLVLVAFGASPAVAGSGDSNERPLAEAGLDQTVTRNATVVLDAGGSRDPDGEITTYEWSIETPNGSTVTPRCPSCERTEFAADAVGQYNVTVTVTDDEGATATDTLYVTVAAPPDGPTVSLSGDTTPTVDDPAEYEASATAGDAALASIMWTVGGRAAVEQNLSGDDVTRSLIRTFDDASPRTVRVTITDENGRTATDALRVDPEPQRGNGNSPPSTERPEETDTPREPDRPRDTATSDPEPPTPTATPEPPTPTATPEPPERRTPEPGPDKTDVTVHWGAGVTQGYAVTESGKRIDISERSIRELKNKFNVKYKHTTEEGYTTAVNGYTGGPCEGNVRADICDNGKERTFDEDVTVNGEGNSGITIDTEQNDGTKTVVSEPGLSATSSLPNGPGLMTTSGRVAQVVQTPSESNERDANINNDYDSDGHNTMERANDPNNDGEVEMNGVDWTVDADGHNT